MGRYLKLSNPSLISVAMNSSVPRHGIRYQRRSRLGGSVILVALLAVVGFSSVLLFWTVGARADELSDLVAGSSGQLQSAPTLNEAPEARATLAACEAARKAFEDALPVPTPNKPSNYVVQLVNESNTTLLAAANAAHVAGMPPFPVLPREGTWVIQPKGVLTVDIPPEWESTIPKGSVGPLFWARTGCRFDIAHNLAQCETGGCSGIYDCSKANQSTTGPKALAEWTFNDTNHNSAPDISVVDGVNLNMDIEPVGPHSDTPVGPVDAAFWLGSANLPLTKCGEDLRAVNNCPIPGFRLKRGDLSFFIKGRPGTDDVVACFSNCGRYKFPTEPDLHCTPDPIMDPRCYLWKSFCCAFPVPGPSPYDIACTSDSQCTQNGGCWNPGNDMPKCACTAFIKKDTCPPDVCTNQFSEKPSFQPPFGHCKDVTDQTQPSEPTACIGDDTLHQVMPRGLTWPNDPETFFSDAKAFRIIFTPGGTSVPITSSGDIPACSSLPNEYRPAGERENCSGPINMGALFAGARLSPECKTNSDCTINGEGPFGCNPQTHHCDSWDCNIGDGIDTKGVLCRW